MSRGPSRSEPRSLRATSRILGVQTGLLVVAILVIVGSILYVIYDRAVGSTATTLLREAVVQVREPDDAPSGMGIAIQGVDGRLRVSAHLPPGLPDLVALAAVRRDGRTREYSVDDDAHDRAYVVRTAEVDGRVVQVVQDREEGEESHERLLSALLVATGVGVVLAGLVAAWLARRTVQPLARTVALQHRFVADASHELRTPLTLLSTRTQLLARHLRRTGDASSAADADAVVADTTAMAEILEELLVAADPGSSADRVRVDLVALAEGVVAACTARARELSIDLDLDLDVTVEARPVIVEGVPSSLRRAVTALVDNALDHAASRVEVVLRVVGRRTHLEVRDDGPGIPADVLPRLFERFASARQPSSDASRRHYGLGLALVADVAAAHGGEIRAGARAGASGAVLDLSLPMVTSGRVPRNRRQPRRPGPSAGLNPAGSAGLRRADAPGRRRGPVGADLVAGDQPDGGDREVPGPPALALPAAQG
ncbi:MAG: HAMP domain-containing sensor histidine kinase, partial [Nocardioidaceae bacterium]